MYGDEDGQAVAAEDVAPMSTWQHTRLRTDASSQAIVDEHTAFMPAPAVEREPTIDCATC